MAKRQRRGGAPLSKVDVFELKRCKVVDFIDRERLMLEGVGRILRELSSSHEGVGQRDDFQPGDVSSRSLWTLGNVVGDLMERVEERLEAAGQYLQAAGVPEFLGAEQVPILQRPAPVEKAA